MLRCGRHKRCGASNLALPVRPIVQKRSLMRFLKAAAEALEGEGPLKASCEGSVLRAPLHRKYCFVAQTAA